MNKRFMNKYFIVPSLLFGLTACTSNNDLFDCPAGKGVGCQSISEVNRRVDRGDFENQREERTDSLKALAPVAMTFDDRVQPSSPGIERVPEKNLRLWIAPFQDEDGNFHEESAIHTIVRQGRWKLRREV